MALGYSSELDLVAIGDTANLRAYLDSSHGQMLDPSDILSVLFQVQAPDGTRNTYQGVIEDDGAGLLQYNDTVLEGHYVVVATFSLADGSTKSTRSNFEVQDAFTEPLLFPDDPLTAVAQGVWHKIEDIFDSEDGGPWLREMTLRYFNPSKMSDFVNEAIYDFNYGYNPPTSYALNDFAQSTDYVNSPNPMLPLIIEGTYIAVIRHLMRSYVEQPAPQGGQVNYEDRRDYQMRWKAIYDIEMQMYARWVHFAKIGVFGFGQTSQSIFSYSRSVGMGNYRYGRGNWGIWR